MNSNERLELLARIAAMYYEERLTQEQTAARTGYSRSMVSRLLAEARDQGVIEVRIYHPLERRVELEQALKDQLGLELVRVLVRGTLTYAQMLRRLGSLAARLVEELVTDGMALGLSWGTALWETVNALRPQTIEGVHVVQMIGSLGTPDPEMDGPELARRFAHTFGGRYSTLSVPLFVDSETTRDALLKDPRVQRAMAYCRQAGLALVGVGTIDPERASLLRASYLTVQQLEELRHVGAVGDVCAIHFDIQGRLIDVPLTRRIMGIDAATLSAIPKRVGVAGGQYKGGPIVGASRAGLINMLVTDEVAATTALRVIQEESHQ